MYAILDIIQKIYKPRTCRLPLDEESVKKGRFKPCLEYHIKNARGHVSTVKLTKNTKRQYVKHVKSSKGNTREVQKMLQEEMMKRAEKMEFEEAEVLKQRWIALNNFAAKSEIVSHTITDVDVFTIIDDEEKHAAFINYIHVKNGAINQSFTYEYKRKLDETDKELLNEAILEIRERFQSSAKRDHRTL